MPAANGDGCTVKGLARELEELAARISEAAVTEPLAGDGPPVKLGPLDSGWHDPGEWARRIYFSRRIRDRLFGDDMFAEPRWDMMLDLYIAHHEQRRISVSSACIASAVPSTTALRHLQELVDRGLIRRHACEQDARRVYVCLTADALGRMDIMFNRLTGGPDTSPESARRPS